MLTSGRVIHHLATLYAALDRLRSYLPEGNGAAPLAGRDYLDLAAHDVVRAWKQLCRETQALEQEATHAAADALDRAARALGSRETLPPLSKGSGGDS